MARKNRRSSGSRNRRIGSSDERPAWWKRLLRKLFILVVLAALVGAASVAGIFWFYGRDLPEVLEREDYQPKQMSRVYAADGELLAEFAVTGGRRTVVPLEKIPDHVQHAFMAAEDADFMTHEGIDYLGMVRAFYNAAVHDTGLKGTSTITQQVVKNLILTPERTLERKIKEILLARELEQNLSKQDILYMYLNTIYLGSGTNGIEEAAQSFFAKPASDLTLAEAATLAGMTQAPERWNPRRHPDEVREKRRSYVLRQLWEKGFIDEAAYRKADASALELGDYRASHPHLGAAPYFVEHVRRKLVEHYGREKVYTGGLRVYTSLDVDDQKTAVRAARQGLRDYDRRHKLYRPRRRLEGDESIAEHRARIEEKKELADGLRDDAIYEAVVLDVDASKPGVTVAVGESFRGELVLEPRSRILGLGDDARPVDKVFERGHVVRVQPAGGDEESPRFRFERGPEVALVTIDPESREVRALVGGYDFEINEYNHATQARRQPGSTFKPIVYAAALEQKIITPATIYYDSPKVFTMPGGKTYSPKNSDGSYRGPIRIREGLAASRNVVAVRVLDDLGIDAAIEFARKIGIESELVRNITLVMGSSSLAPLELVNAYTTFAAGGTYAEPSFLRRVETTGGETEYFEKRPREVLAPDVAYLIVDLMRSVIEGYVDVRGRKRGGTAWKLRKIGRPAAGKTGTTNDYKDAWFVGFTPDLVTGVWVGYDDNRSLGSREYGGKVAGPIWLEAMQGMHEGTEPRDFPKPETGITTERIDPETGKLVREGGIVESFLVGTAPTQYAPSSDGADSADFMLDQFEDGAAGDTADDESSDEP
jgi:penicillin-binding protein 1A